MEEEEYSLLFKIILIGDANVGKTNILSRYISDTFLETSKSTVGVELATKVEQYNNKKIKIQIWDTAGQERYKGLIPSYVRNSSIVFLVYDVSKRTSFEHINDWIEFVRNIERTTMVLIGNKIDLNREVEKNEGEELAQKEGLIFFECSAKNNENIKNLFFSSVAVLPTFGVYDESEKDTIIRELLEENGGDDIKEGGENLDLFNQPPAQMNVDGEITMGNKKRKKCAC